MRGGLKEHDRNLYLYLSDTYKHSNSPGQKGAHSVDMFDKISND